MIEEVQSKGVTEAEVSQAVKQLTVEMLVSVRTPLGLGQFVGTVLMVLGDADQAKEDLQKYLKVKPADVQRVAKAYFHPNKRTVVILQPDRGEAGAPAASKASAPAEAEAQGDAQ